MNVAAYVVAVVLFVLAGLGVHIDEIGELDLVAFGLAAFALGHTPPPRQMRSVAFLFLVSAAVDWPALWLDRAGVALVGVGFLALALPSRPRRIRRPVLPRVPAVQATVADVPDELEGIAARRIREYSGVAGTGA